MTKKSTLTRVDMIVLPSKHSAIFLLICCLLLTFNGCGNSSSTSTRQASDTNTISPLPVVSRGRVYVNTGTLHIFDSKTGTALGTYKLGNHGSHIESDPTILDDTIYIAGQMSASPGTPGNSAVYALRESDGSLQWQAPSDILSNSLPVSNGLVYVYSTDHILSALQTSNEVARWHDSHIDIVFLTIAQSMLYLSASDSSISALNATTGAILWHQYIGGRWLDGLAVSDGVLFVSGQAGIFALRISDGKTLWHATPAHDFTAPVVVRGIVYVIATNGILYSLHAADGQVLWHFFLPSGTILFGKAPLAVVDNLVLYTGLLVSASGSSSGKSGVFLATVRVHDGSKVWQDWLGSGGIPSLTVEDNITYTIASAEAPGYTLKDIVYAIQISTGKQLWQTSIAEK